MDTLVHKAHKDHKDHRDTLENKDPQDQHHTHTLLIHPQHTTHLMAQVPQLEIDKFKLSDDG